MRKAFLALLAGILVLQAVSLVQASGKDAAVPKDESRAAVVQPTSALPPVVTPRCPDPTPRNVVKVIRCLNNNIGRLRSWINQTFIRCTTVVSVTRYGDPAESTFGYVWDPGGTDPLFDTSALDLTADESEPHLHFMVWKTSCQHG